jgi:hypothetical protein
MGKNLRSFASTMVGQSEQLIQEKNRNMMKAIIGTLVELQIPLLSILVFN